MHGTNRARIRSFLERGRRWLTRERPGETPDRADEATEPEPHEEAMPEESQSSEPAAPLDPEEVEQVLDRIRPALQADGGDIDLVKVEDNDVYVTLVGACAGCPSASITLRMGVERLLRQEFPHMGRLVQVGGMF